MDVPRSRNVSQESPLRRRLRGTCIRLRGLEDARRRLNRPTVGAFGARGADQGPRTMPAPGLGDPFWTPEDPKFTERDDAFPPEHRCVPEARTGISGVTIGRIFDAGERLRPEGAPRRRDQGWRRQRMCHHSCRNGQFDAFAAGVPGLLGGVCRCADSRWPGSRSLGARSAATVSPGGLSAVQR